ncbi:MAG: outer membrane protein assembly factor BamA [Xanthobacteraceae bacterium]|jgi:outer membrane protein insertion porin family|nr:outer membrane protein assembly factor BamA [Xanthobacteraceae bacterium]
MGVRFLRGLVLAGSVLGAGAFTLSVGVVSITSLFATSSAVAQTSASIVVEGNRRVEADTIRSYFRTVPGQRLDSVKIDEGLKALYATGLFQDVQIANSGGRLVVRVVENSVINRVAFEGNKKVKEEQLSTEVQSKPRGALSRAAVQGDTQRIVEIYQRNGYFDVRVEPKMIDLPNNRVDLVFEINEGGKTAVKELRFVGNKAYSGYRLKEVIKTTESGLLAFLQSNDIYDPDRVEADRDLLRRFYLKHGYADVRIVAAMGEYDPSRKGFLVTFTIDEGEQYRFGTVEVQSSVRAIDPTVLRGKMRTSAGSVYNAEAVEKSVEEMTIEASRRGYAFASVRPRGDRDAATRTVNLVYVIEEGQRAYIERINVRGNTRTRDYVIRREFDLAEGDAYNRALVDRAERRLKNLNYFKSVKITNEPGSAPDRVVVNVDVVEQSTGEFSIAGGYSTADGFIGEVSVGERNLLGRGQYAKATVRYGQKTRGFELSFAEPYLFDYRLLWGIDLFAKTQLAANTVSYDSTTIGASTRLGFALREDLSLQARYSIYRQEITLPDVYNNCLLSPNATQNGGAGVNQASEAARGSSSCFADGEASLAVRKELAQGAVIVSAIGYTLAYNTVDNNKSPTSGMYAELKQDFAGVGGDVNFIRTTGDVRSYYEVMPDLVSLFRVQGGNISGWGSKDLRMLDHFQMGPNLVRGFAPAGIGPRDLTSVNQDALGGTLYWGASVELQMPLFFLPKDMGIRASVYADAGSLYDYQGPTSWAATGETISPVDESVVRSSVGAGLIWDSPFGPLRFDLAVPVTKAVYDKTQIFRFSGGTKF